MSKERYESKKEVTIVGIVREIEDQGQAYRVGIATGNDFYVVKLNEEGRNLLYEVGSKVEATGIISQTRKGENRISVTGYEVYEMNEDDPEAYGDAIGYGFRPES